MITLFRQIGATIMANACGPCIGQWKRHTDDPTRKNSIVTSFNRNFAKRADGNPNTFAFVASPEIVMALTIAGDLCFNPLKDRLLTHEGKKVKFSEPVGDELPVYGFTSPLLEQKLKSGSIRSRSVCNCWLLSRHGMETTY